MMKLFSGATVAFLVLSAGSAPAFAQNDAPVNTDAAASQADAQSAVDEKLPWLYENSDVPVDKSWTFGVLPNGLKYAVKQNNVPAAQVAIRVRIDAGSLYEKDSERGYAHLLEHLSFRGSEYVPDGESKRIWQRFGVSFGSDSNASTSPTETVYKLDLPNSSPAKFDESMKILSGMMRAPNIDTKALTAERAIVLAEMRENSGAAKEMGDNLRAHFFAGQPLAARAPIGTLETLNASTVEGLAAFHKRWYRPDKTVVVIAGDESAPVLEAAIKKHFGAWQATGAPAPQPDFGKPTPQEKRAKVYVEPNLPTTANIAYLRPWEKVDDTIVYNQQLLIDLLATNIINRRLAVQARSANSSFLYAQVSQDDISRSADVTTVSLSPVADDWETAVKDVRATIADAIAKPPSTADIERESKLFSRAIQTLLDSYPFEAAAKQADEIVRAVDIRETVAAPQTVVDVFSEMQPLLTPSRLHDATKKIFSANAQRIFLSTPTTVADGEKRLAAALNAVVEGNAGARLAQDNIGFDDLPKLGKPGKLELTATQGHFNMELAKFENGTRVLLFPNKAESGQVRLLVRFGKGKQAVAPSDAGLLWTGPIILNENGIGKFTQTQIDQLGNGRRLSLDFDVADDAFEFSATTSTADMADQLRLIATKMEYPGSDKAPLSRAQAYVKSGYDSFQMSANTVLQRDLQYLLRAEDPRWKMPDPADAQKISNRAVKKFWKPLLKSGSVEVILMGDFERDDAIAALSKTFGAMKPRNAATANLAALQLKFPAASKTPLLRKHRGPADQAAAVIAWPTGGGLTRVTESRELEVLAAVFRDRLFEKFRAEQAASYSPNMSNSWPLEFSSGGYLMSISLVQPKDVNRFFEFSEQVAADLAVNPVSDDELKRAVEPIAQLIERVSSGNTFWLNELKGATYDRRRFQALARLLSDYKQVSPERLQQLAKQYFVDDKSWRLAVLPENAMLTSANDNGDQSATASAAAVSGSPVSR